MFKYSPRPYTAAAKMKDDVPEAEKAERLNQVIAKQKIHTKQRNRSLIGTVQSVLIDGHSKKNPNEKIGRTDSNKLVILKEDHADIGDFIDILITGTAGVSLFGKINKP